MLPISLKRFPAAKASVAGDSQHGLFNPFPIEGLPFMLSRYRYYGDAGS